MSNSGESQHQCLKLHSQSLQENQAWSGRRESNSRSQLGKLKTRHSVLYRDPRPWSFLDWVVPSLTIAGRYKGVDRHLLTED